MFAFSGRGAIKRNHFEWRKTLDQLPVNYVLLRDDDTSWFHFCFDDVITRLWRPDLCIGSSMGGYAALMFGAWWRTKVVSFCPQTTISVKGRQSVGDGRWPDDMRRIHKHSHYPEFFDLEMEGPDYRIVYCKGNGEDAAHANRMKVTLVGRECKVHNVAAGMAEDQTDWNAFFEL